MISDTKPSKQSTIHDVSGSLSKRENYRFYQQIFLQGEKIIIFI